MDILNSRTGLLLSSLLLGVFLVQPAQAQPGIAAGANFDKLSDVETNSGEATFENATGFHVGLFYDMTFGPLALRPGVYYMDVGDFSTEEGFQVDEDVEQQNFDLSLVEIPIDARFRLATLPILSPYLTAGPVFRVALNDDTSEEGAEAFGLNSNDVSVAGNVGFGVEIDLPGPGLRLFPELRYSFGLTGYASEFQTPVGTIEAEDGGRLNTYMLRLGLSF